jgi:hypothetical protein
MMDWLEAFQESPLLDVTPLDLNDRAKTRHYMARLHEFPLIVVMHSVLGDELYAGELVAPALAARKGKLLALIGNEYERTQGKTAFLNAVGADYVGTQIPMEAGRWLWAGAASTTVLPAPHALNPKIYKPHPEIPRTHDLGFRGAMYPLWIGDEQRNTLIRRFQEQADAFGLTADIKVGYSKREDYMRQICSWRWVMGGEAGTDFLQRDDDSLNKARKLIEANPDITLDALHEQVYSKATNYICGKAISSRHFEPIGVKTTQILMEGAYNDLLKPGEHYLSVRPDFSNLAEIAEQLKDETFRESMAVRTLDYVLEGHTHQHRVSDLVKAAMV